MPQTSAVEKIDGDTSTAPALTMRGIGKTFAGVPVLKGVDFTLEAGEVHALMGENGAGKSTLMKIAAGIHDDYEGEIVLFGEPVRLRGARDAMGRGIAVIHQELNLVPGMTVAENIFLGREQVRAPFLVDARAQARATTELLAGLNFQASANAQVGGLRVGEQQLVEIAKALSLEARILIMDEPTSALSVAEAHRLQTIVADLAARGVAIVYISHRLEEIFELARNITVLRDGRLAGTVPVAATSRQDLIRMMAGRDVQEFFAHGRPAASADTVPVGTAPTRSTAPLLELRDVWLENPRPTRLRPRLLDGVSLDLAAGEVLGLAGLMGAGRTELLETLFGVRGERHGGTVRIDGRPVDLATPQAAKAAGVALVTEDRKRDGLALGLALDRNLGLPVMPTLARAGVVVPGRERGLALRTIAAMAVRARGPEQPAGTLSGGNQQKIVVGKWLATRPRILLLDEPTRGIDVGAKAEIYRLINELSAQGMAIIVASSEMPELLALSHRILVLREGRPTALLERPAFAAETILDHASPGGAIQDRFQAAQGVR